jgi:diguanylate cyclase (GGDEF)-like protein
VSDNTSNKTVITAISNLSEPTETKEACLVVIYGLDLGKKFNLGQPTLVVGRSSKADIQIDQEAVSRNHCKLINNGHSVVLRDLGSTNGTFVNDELIDEYLLRDGDFIKIGRCIFKFLTGNNIESAYHEEIYRLTTVDGLTQVYNKRYFLETLEREIGRAERYHRELSLILFDIDHFKSINDNFGHLAGDYVLKHMAVVLKGRIRREDVLARYGGEEFAIILPEIDNQNALRFGEKIRRIIERASFRFEDVDIPVTISVGVTSLLTSLVHVPAALFVVADDYLYSAKAAGRNRVMGSADAEP